MKKRNGKKKKTLATDVPCVVHFFDVFLFLTSQNLDVIRDFCCCCIVCLRCDAHIKCYIQFMWNTTSFFPRRPRNSMRNPLILSQIDDHKHFTVTIFNCILKMFETKIIFKEETISFINWMDLLRTVGGLWDFSKIYVLSVAKLYETNRCYFWDCDITLTSHRCSLLFIQFTMVGSFPSAES